jgi:hypothetical protein
MTTLHVNLASNEALAFEPARHALRLTPAVGGAQLQVSVRIRRTSERTEGPACQITAALLVGTNPSRSRQLLTQLAVGHAINPGQVATDITLSGYVSDEQLRAAEQLRGGQDLWATLQIFVICVDGDPVQLVGGTGELGFDLPSGEWGQELDKVDGGSYVEVLVPLPDNAELATAVRRIRKARTLVRDNHLEEALGETRKAIEAIRAAAGTLTIAQTARPKPSKERDQQERWAIMVEDVFGLLSGAAHDDPETTEHFDWSRADAVALIATTAGLLGRLVERERQGTSY